ncbi:leucine zipper putative tumor suppressor 1 [Rhineura floridana]|uniref:leucine zipper putative tumor suppressor 1 n=1 Tax=Rhineura floridana TaxID=261503 RepID=UPI002AC86BC5|nr:leucine zipper putative tumor suppressor 1 [Rhineura floridana]XP_061448956.1 leucine zipper putative tumor suppressor 1 [Rhineura floridana]XP_061448957.1 leucine zipper putative tumor suppressor 1 [Rhineura floridana]XP_061448958.1 leucine zipper putative tumor suppressor 1 [Rhineura floridana]XP_061448959.1 leucine zipper putative tumor suppressor 1 [Rhineura floridana]XP_061448960.1 leucine zipper putative tumor suppressor 1 [Rhineura floridana]XP_061448961.1 leucine zipper putative tu
MGSVSSLISGHSFHSKHCRASQYKLRKSSHLKKLNRYSDGLLKFGFSQETGHNKSSSKGNKNEDFFYIKVNQKAHRTEYAPLSGGELGSQAGRSSVDYGTPTPPKLKPISNQLELATDKSATRPTAFKPVTPRSNTVLHSSPEHAGHAPQKRQSLDKPKDLDLKPALCSGGLSDSGRNSMSSLPTHSTASSYQLDPLVAPVGPMNRFGGSALNITQCTVLQDSNMMSLKALSFSDGGTKILNPGKVSAHPNAAEKNACIRSPISTEESAIQELEQKLLEREGELQELQCSFEEKEITSCQSYEEKQRRCRDEMEGLKQKCNSKLKQTSQKSQKVQQLLQLQVFQLQQDKRQLREELANLMKEQDLLETKLRSYEKEKTAFAPALEETQWEVCQKSGEISLLKQQLKESQTELNSKTNEVLNLKAQLKDLRAKMELLDMKIQDLEDSLHAKAMELEVCENELQRKKNESELLREKVNLLEQEIAELRTELTILREEMKCGVVSVGLEGGMTEEAQALWREVEKLKTELGEARESNEQMTVNFQQERQTWKEEKEKVIHYQKQLQQSYLHMYKRNQNLEKMLQQLAAGEDGKEPLDLDLHGTDVPYEDIIATEI